MNETFKITGLERHGPEELLERLRKVRLLKDPQAFPYQEARLELKKISFDQVWPAQRYVLAAGLKKTQNLEWELAKYGVNLFALGGYVTIRTNRSEEPIDLLPPIIEAWTEDDGRQVNIINDGMHRMFVARLEWRRPEVVLVRDLPPQYPYYAYPIPDGDWGAVTIVEGSEIPAGLIKKWHRRPDNKRLYRDFNSAFVNVGGPRGQAGA